MPARTPGNWAPGTWIFDKNSPLAVNSVPVAQPNFVNNSEILALLDPVSMKVQLTLVNGYMFTEAGVPTLGSVGGATTGDLYVDTNTGILYQLQLVMSVNTWVEVGTLFGSASGINVSIGGNTAGAPALISSGTVLLAGGNNITLSQNGQSITISGAAGGGGAAGTQTISAAGQSVSGTGLSLNIVAGNNITLSATTGANAITVSITGVAASGAAVNAISVPGGSSAGTLTLSAGPGITISSSGNSIIGISGNTTVAQTNFSLNGTSSSVSLSAGAGIGTGQANSTITISASVQTITQSMTALGNTTLGNTGTFSGLMNISGAGNISVGVSGDSLTISGAQTAPGNVVNSLNGSSGVLSISAGAGIGVGQAASTITISASVQTSSVLMTATGVTTSSSAGTFSNGLTISGAGIVSVGVGSGSITISATTPNVTNYSTISGSVAGNNLGAASTTFTVGNSLSLSGAGIVSVGASAGTITISASTPSVTNFSTVSLSAVGNTTNSASGTFNNVLSVSGGGIVFVGASNNNLTISASQSVQGNLVSNFGISSITAGGTTAGTTTVASGPILLVAGSNIELSSSAGAITIIGQSQTAPANVVNSIGPSGSLSSGSITISGVNITVSSNGAGVIQLSANSQTVQGNLVSNFGISSITAGGSTSGITTVASGPILLAAGSNITLSSSAGGITIIGPTAGGGAAGTQTISASGTSITGTAISLALVAGANISLQTATAAGAMTVSISGENAVSLVGAASTTGTLSIAAGNNISFSTNGGGPGITINNLLASKVSLTQNLSFNEINLAVVTGTVSSGATSTLNGFGSSLFLQRIFIPAQMNLTEVDLAQAMSVSSSGTASGAGQMYQSFGLYSLVNSTSLSLLFSASSSWSWSNGTATTAGAVSLTEFAGGWTGNLVHSMGLSSGTSGTSSLSAGEYVVANIVNFSMSSSVWSVSLFGNNIMLTSTSSAAMATALSAAGSASVISNGSTLSYAGISNAGTAVLSYLSATATAASSVSLLLNAGTSAWPLFSTGGLISFNTAWRVFSVTNSTTGITMGATATAGALSGLSAISTGTFTTHAGSYFSATTSTAATIFTAAPSTFVISGVGSTALLSTGAFTGFTVAPTGMNITAFNAAPTQAVVLSSLALAALSSATFTGMAGAPTQFSVQGTGSTLFTAGYPNNFIAGIASTGALPAAISLQNTQSTNGPVVTYSGSFAFNQPWFALIGS